MTKIEARIYYSALLKRAEMLLLIGIDIIVIIPLLVEKYYAYTLLFIALNIMEVKMDVEFFNKVKEETNIKELNPEDKEEEENKFLEALLKGAKGLLFTSVVLIAIILFELQSINSDAIRILSIIVTGLFIRLCLNIYLNKVWKKHLQIS